MCCRRTPGTEWSDDKMQEEIACREMKVKCVGGGGDHDAVGALMSTAAGVPALDRDFVVILWKWQRSD